MDTIPSRLLYRDARSGKGVLDAASIPAVPWLMRDDTSEIEDEEDVERSVSCRAGLKLSGVAGSFVGVETGLLCFAGILAGGVERDEIFPAVPGWGVGASGVGRVGTAEDGDGGVGTLCGSESLPTLGRVICRVALS